MPRAAASVEDTGEPVTGSIPTSGLGRALSPERACSARCGQYRRLLSRLGLAAAIALGRALRAPARAAAVGRVDRARRVDDRARRRLSGAIDFALFYASGQVMDRFGRLWAALPAMVLMGLGFLALAFTHDLPSADAVVRRCSRWSSASATASRPASC